MSYSSFFISGLLSPGSSSSSSASAHSRTSSDASLFYFTVSPTRDDYRSFLSLDLAQCFPDSVIVPDSPSVLPAPSPRALPAPDSCLPSVPDALVVEASLSRSPTPVQRKPSVASQATRASATSSTVSTHYRRTRRNQALAALEGRKKSPKFEVTGNFMSLSEDEDEEDDIDLSLTNDQLAMLIDNPYYLPAPNSAPAPTSTFSTSTPPAHKRPRRQTALGLQSFMDMHNEDDNNTRWSWRSFIEIAS
ncbi:hypothetical protein C8F01DRAFT_537166 [Mycena amicta]|nr:hypothetical protein C8F01DRAFT_537166 [Mycena amicta]